MSEWLIILLGVVVWAGIVGWLFHWYWLSAVYWPLVGRVWRCRWRAWRAERKRYVLPAWEGPDSPQSPVPVEEDEDWPEEPPETWVEDLPPEQPIELVPADPVYLALSDDPDLVVWDAKQQAARCWEIVHVEFPRLRTQLLAEYAVAA